MTDYSHKIWIADDGFRCAACGVQVPADVATVDTTVVELGGAGMHWVPAFAYEGAAIACGKRSENAREVAVLACSECVDGEKDGATCDACNGFGVVDHEGNSLVAEEAEIAGVKKEAAPLLEFEKEVRRGAFRNFNMMREATRPNDA